MKALGTACAMVLGAAVAFAAVPNAPDSQSGSKTQQPAADTSKPAGDHQHPAMTGDKTGDMSKHKDKKTFKAEVVSTDATAKTITVKKMDGSSMTSTDSSEMTMSVDPAAESTLGQVSAGDKVKLVCKTDASGKQIVSRIERVDTRPAGDQSPKP